jgi:hypothetical protein
MRKQAARYCALSLPNWNLKKKAQAGACVLLSQDEARFPLVPTLRATLGVKGHRPTVGTWDNKDQVYQNMAEDHTCKGVGECHPYREFEGMQPSR